jgi:hypothetical protein
MLVDEEQPVKPLVTVAVYVPVAATGTSGIEGFFNALLKPLGPDHAKVTGIPKIPSKRMFGR